MGGPSASIANEGNFETPGNKGSFAQISMLALINIRARIFSSAAKVQSFDNSAVSSLSTSSSLFGSNRL